MERSPEAFPRRAWSGADLDRLRQLYSGRRTDAVAAALRRSVKSVYTTANKLGLTKSETFLASPESGRLRKGQSRPGSEATRFQPGQAPANKGLRRPGWHSGRMRETQFQKGERSGIAAKNWHPIGSIVPDSEGYLRIKVREAVHGVEPSGFGNVRVWPLLQRHVWRQEHGPIPEGHVIIFKNGNRADCGLSNLECVPRAELARRNRMWNRYPREMAEAIQALGALKRKLRSYGKKQNV